MLSNLAAAPSDPILGVTEAFNADTAPDKVNLGVGVYLDENGKTPLMDCVRVAETDLAARHRPRGYLPQTGMPVFDAATQELVFGPDCAAVKAGRVATLQTLAGTGALRVGAGLLALACPDAPVLLSDPSWENHEALFSRAGLSIGRYRYYDPAGRRLDVDGMVADLAQAAPGSIVVLHGCCHNPTGYDLTPADWDRVVAVLAERQLVPFIDMAYQGLARGLDEDRYGVEACVRAGLDFLVANSFSKIFGLYGERVGALSIVASDAAEASRIVSQAKVVVRSLYSNPPTQGAAIVSGILTTPELKASWEQELAVMRQRIIDMRAAFRAGLEAAGVTQDLSYITSQTGLFSYSGLSTDQMRRLREDHIYGLDSGRLCVAGLNPGNLDKVVAAVAAVMG